MANVKFTAKEKQFVESVQKMHGAVGGLAAKLNVDLVRAFRTADKEQREFNKGIVRSGKDLQNFGAEWSMNVTAPLLGFAGVSMKVFGDLEAVSKGLEVVEGSTAGASAALERIKAIAKLPGLGMQEAAQGYTNMRSLGFAAEFTERALKAVGNAVAIGGKGKFEFNNIITQLNQMASKSSVLAEDLKPILNSAPMIAMKIKEIYGTINGEDINKQLTGGTKEFIETLVAGLETVPSAASGAKNAFENFGDSLIVAGANIGEVIDKSTGLTNGVNLLGDAIVKGSEYFKNMNATTKDSIVFLGGLALAVGPVTYAVGGLVTRIPGLIAGLNATRFAAGGLVGVLGGLAWLLIDHQKHLNDVAKATESVELINAKISAQYSNEIKQVSDLLEVLRSEKSTKEQIKKAKEDLLKIDPSFSKALEGEKINFSLLNDQVSSYINNLTAAAKVKVLQSKIESNVAMEQNIIDDPNTNLSTFDKLQLGAGGIMLSMVGKQDNIINTIATKNAQTIIKLREANKKYEDAIKEVYKAGFSPEKEQNNIPKVNTGGRIGGETNKQLEDALKDEISFKLKLIADQNEYFNEQEKILKQTQLGALNISPLDRIDVDKKRAEYNEVFSIYLGEKFNFEADGNSNLQKRYAKLMDNRIAGMERISDEGKMRLMALKVRNAENLNMAFSDSLVDFGEDLISGNGFGNAFAALLGQIGNALMQFGKQALIAEKTIQIVKASFGSGPGAALAAIGAGMAIKLVGQQMKAPRLAKGGMSLGPTYAMIGDNASGKEAVIPFERMGQFLKMAGHGQTKETIETMQRIRGKSIELVTKRHARSVK